MNANEENKTIIMAKFNTATAVRARQEAVYWDVYRIISMYENEQQVWTGTEDTTIG